MPIAVGSLGFSDANRCALARVSSSAGVPALVAAMASDPNATAAFLSLCEEYSRLPPWRRRPSEPAPPPSSSSAAPNTSLEQEAEEEEKKGEEEAEEEEKEEEQQPEAEEQQPEAEQENTEEDEINWYKSCDDLCYYSEDDSEFRPKPAPCKQRANGKIANRGGRPCSRDFFQSKYGRDGWWWSTEEGLAKGRKLASKGRGGKGGSEGGGKGSKSSKSSQGGKGSQASSSSKGGTKRRNP